MSTISEISIDYIPEPDFKHGDGDILQDRYQVVDQTRGGTGLIYFCTDQRSQTPCVLKAPLIQFVKGRTRDDASLFLDEVKNLVNLPPHRNVVMLYRVEVIQDIYFLVMEWVTGSLRGRIATENCISVEEILKISIEITRGMIHCLRWLSKSDGVFVHGDLKPENILMTKDGEVKIADFGIGGYTKEYASPEQLRKERTDSRSDIYSLGKIMLELLESGRKMSAPGSSQEQKLYDIIRGCLAEQVEDRIPSFHQLEPLLEHLYQEITNQEIPEGRILVDEDSLKMQRACDLASIGEYKKAYEMLSTLTTDTGGENNQVLAQGYYNIAEIFRNDHQYEKALEFFECAIRYDHDTHSLIWTNMGVTYRNMGNWKEACICLEHALKIDPYDCPAIDNKIDCLINLNRSGELRYLLESLQMLYDNRPDETLLKSMAYILYVEKDFKNASLYYEHYLRHRKDDWYAVYYYAMSLYMECDTTKAMECFEKAIQMMVAGGADKETPTKLFYLAVSCYSLLDFKRAVMYLEKFHNLAGRNSQSEYFEEILFRDILIGERYHTALRAAANDLSHVVWTNHPQRFYADFIKNLEEQWRQWEQELPDGHDSRMVRHMYCTCFSYEVIACMELRRNQNALEVCNHALFWDHSSPENLYNKGMILCKMERYEEALICFDQALAHQRKLDRESEIRRKIWEVRDMMKDSKN